MWVLGIMDCFGSSCHGVRTSIAVLQDGSMALLLTMGSSVTGAQEPLKLLVQVRVLAPQLWLSLDSNGTEPVIMRGTDERATRA